MLQAGDHVVVSWPGYQSLYECARMMGADVGVLIVICDLRWYPEQSVHCVHNEIQSVPYRLSAL